MSGSASRASGFAAFRHKPYALYWCARFFSTVAIQMQAVAIGWQVYSNSHDALDLGLVGLALFLPSIGLVLVTGQAADRYDRRVIILLCLAADFVYAALLCALSFWGVDQNWPIFAILIAIGIDRAFLSPASFAIVPNLVPEKDLANAVAWQASAFQVATIGGPAVGGAILAFGTGATYAVSGLLTGVSALLMALNRTRVYVARKEPVTWSSVLGGLTYIRSQPIVFGAISLDLFAVLLGGCVALYPVYASDILHVGAEGLGLMRSAPAVGALLCSLWLTQHPPQRRVGLAMFGAVALFGLGTVAFGFSTWFPFSLAALFVMGASDMVSVYVRQTLIQLATPDEMRGRVSAVSAVFIGASNDFGDFRAGTIAAAIGAVPAVVAGGAATIAVTALWTRFFPALRNVQRLDRSPPIAP
jgi:MFS family permease